jgi:pimeloyl-ACP methyl ester carboxylesterase
MEKMSTNTLVLLPGLLCDSELWSAQIKALECNWNIRVQNLIGSNNMQVLAQQVIEQSPETFALAGFSMGGYCALEIMRQASHRVQRLALIDTSARDDDEPHRVRREMLIKLGMQSGIEAVLDQLLPLFVNETSARDQELVARIRQMGRRIGYEEFVQQQQAIMSRRDQRGILSEISCDTLIICGEEDVLTPFSWHEEMAAKITASKLVTVPDSGHFTLMEQAETVTRAMQKWLENSVK